MPIHLHKASESDCPLLHDIQVKSFSALLEKYRDFDTNPAAESVERVYQRFAQPFTDYYLILEGDSPVGMLRVCDFGEECRLSPICVLPAFQGRGIAQQAMVLAEDLYPAARKWTLDTILQEARLCRLYEKMGYQRTGGTIRSKTAWTWSSMPKMYKQCRPNGRHSVLKKI